MEEDTEDLLGLDEKNYEIDNKNNFLNSNDIGNAADNESIV